MRKVRMLEQGTTEWLEWRQQGIGGSEVASVMKANPWKSALALFEEKTQKGTGEVAENENMKRGKDLEPVARSLYSDLMNWVVRPVCVLHDTADEIRCSLDGLRDDDQLVFEAKAPKNKGHAANLLIAAEENPDLRIAMFRKKQEMYFSQCQYQMAITDAPLCHFVSYNNSPEFSASDQMAIIPIRKDDAYCELLLSRVSEFWHSFVLPRIPPPRNW